MNIYLISAYQVAYNNGTRDSVKPVEPIKTDDIEKTRSKLRLLHNSQSVNLTYTIINADYELE